MIATEQVCAETGDGEIGWVGASGSGHDDNIEKSLIEEPQKVADAIALL